MDEGGVEEISSVEVGVLKNVRVCLGLWGQLTFWEARRRKWKTSEEIRVRAQSVLARHEAALAPFYSLFD